MHQRLHSWFAAATLGWLCVSCASVQRESNIADAEQREFHGDNHVFGAYFNAALEAAKSGDRVTAKKYFLRAYRNTGIVLQPAADSRIQKAVLGKTADLGNFSEVLASANQLDSLTPPPGTGPVTNDVLDAAINGQRSLAAYDWALAAGHLGDFEGAERALLYSLHLEEIRAVNPHDKLLASRHFELARLYHAWGKTELYLQHYRAAMAATDKEMLKSDPIGYANILDEFSALLTEAGLSNEASQIRAQSAEIRRKNPDRKAIYTFENYPKLKTP
jgi:tetratricopeptide (TPR) repeat protein